MQTKNTTLDNYNVNFGKDEISMINLRDNTVSLIIYDKNKFNTKDYYFSYKLSSNEHIAHKINSENYNYEVTGPNGFVRKFKGSKSPKIEVTLSNNILQNAVELTLNLISDQKVTANLENVYLSDSKDIIINNQEVFTFNLDRTRGWYDLKIKTEHNSWHFTGRIELGRVS